VGHPTHSAVLVWDDLPHNVEALGKCEIRCTTDLTKKQLRMVGYLFEPCYNLAIPPDNNVSRSPGFETLGFFN
jgi:hypothetical protein